jgi:hypothetical protein
MNQTVKPQAIKGNASSEYFVRCAKDFYECKKRFRSPHRKSPVPYFLLCKAIELGIKAKHLRRMTRKAVKQTYWHDLVNAYEALDPQERKLATSEEAILRQADDVYNDKKGFEYLNPKNVLTGYKRYPDLELLDKIAKKIIG